MRTLTMNLTTLGSLLLAGLLAVSCGSPDPSASPSVPIAPPPSLQPTASEAPSVEPSLLPSPEPSSFDTSTPTPEPTPTEEPPTPSPEPTPTPTEEPSPTLEPTPSPTASPTATPGPTATPPPSGSNTTGAEPPGTSAQYSIGEGLLTVTGDVQTQLNLAANPDQAVTYQRNDDGSGILQGEWLDDIGNRVRLTVNVDNGRYVGSTMSFRLVSRAFDAEFPPGQSETRCQIEIGTFTTSEIEGEFTCQGMVSADRSLTARFVGILFANP